jgi:pimeloyl-ACP methyl ester carboxylesterase
MQETIYSHPEKVSSKDVVVDGVRTHYLEAGDPSRPTLMLIHGGSQFGMGSDRWYPNIIPLSRFFHVIAPDELGYGDTDAPADLDLLVHTRTRAEHLIGLIDALQLDRLSVLGQSEGGWIATYVSLTRAAQVERLYLVDSGSTAGSGWKNKGQDRHLPYFDKVFEPGTMLPKQQFRTREEIRGYETEFVYDPSALADPFVDRLVVLAEKWADVYVEHGRRFWADKSTAWPRKYEMYTVDGTTHISEVVHQLTVPTLVVWGKQSNKGVDKGIELFKKIPGAQLHIFDKANHFVWMDQVDGFNRLVRWFYDQSPVRQHAGI